MTINRMGTQTLKRRTGKRGTNLYKNSFINRCLFYFLSFTYHSNVQICSLVAFITTTPETIGLVAVSGDYRFRRL